MTDSGRVALGFNQACDCRRHKDDTYDGEGEIGGNFGNSIPLFMSPDHDQLNADKDEDKCQSH